MKTPEDMRKRKELVARQKRRGRIIEKVGAGLIVVAVSAIFLLGTIALVLALIRLIGWLL